MRATHLIPLFSLTLALSACGTPNRGLESVHQPVVHRTDYVYDVRSGSGLNAYDSGRLDGWLDTLKVGYGDHVALEDPGSDASLRSDIARMLARRGLLLDDTAPVTQVAMADGTARVVVSRMKAEVPGCPDWSRPANPDFESNNMSNYGCATNANLAAMIADPNDLLQGRAGGSVTDAETGAKAIKTYRNNPSRDTGGLKSETTGGK